MVKKLPILIIVLGILMGPLGANPPMPSNFQEEIPTPLSGRGSIMLSVQIPSFLNKRCRVVYVQSVPDRDCLRHAIIIA